METALKEYVDNALPKMIDSGYHLRLAKGGIDYPYLPEQTLLAHILSGVFALARVWGNLHKLGILPLDETEFRRTISLYTLHDLDKVISEWTDTSQFSIPLHYYTEARERLGLLKFVDKGFDPDSQEHRAANTAVRSHYQGDLAVSGEGAVRRWRLVRIADAMASVHLPTDISGIWNHLECLSPRLMRYRLYFHEIRDVRGVLTNQIHTAVSSFLEGHNFFPLLFFPSGNIYFGPNDIGCVKRADLIEAAIGAIVGRFAPTEEDIDP